MARPTKKRPPPLYKRAVAHLAHGQEQGNRKAGTGISNFAIRVKKTRMQAGGLAPSDDQSGTGVEPPLVIPVEGHFGPGNRFQRQPRWLSAVED